MNRSKIASRTRTVLVLLIGLVCAAGVASTNDAAERS